MATMVPCNRRVGGSELQLVENDFFPSSPLPPLSDPNIRGMFE